MKKILVVEDDQEIQNIYQKVLKKEGFKVLQAFEAKEGLVLAKKNEPDLVLLDIMLPGKMNGFDLLEQLKIDRNLYDVPVLVLTNLEDERTTALSIGADDYIVKAEVDPGEVIEKIKKILSSQETPVS